MNRLVLVLLAFSIAASGCLNQTEGPEFRPESSEQINGLDVYYGDSVRESYVGNFAARFNASDDINRVAFENNDEGYGVKIYTKRNSTNSINNLDTQETVNTISREMFDGAEIRLYITTMDGEIAQKATSN